MDRVRVERVREIRGVCPGVSRERVGRRRKGADLQQRGPAPAWSPNGRELLYLAGDQIMAVGYTATGDSFVAEKPRVWADNVRAVVGFDLAPDGSRAAVNVPVATPDASATGALGRLRPEFLR